MLTERLLELAAVGGEWVLYGLLILSVIGVGITIERLVFFARQGCKMDVLIPKVMPDLAKGNMAAVIKTLKADGSEEARMALNVLEWRDSGQDAARRMTEAALLERRPVLEKGTMFLGTVGNNAPFIGLFGTVLGVVQAFKQLGANAGGSMDGVMSSIGEALVATAVGIMVAIPAVIAFNILTRKAIRIEENTELLINILMASADRTEQGKGK